MAWSLAESCSRGTLASAWHERSHCLKLSSKADTPVGACGARWELAYLLTSWRAGERMRACAWEAHSGKWVRNRYPDVTVPAYTPSHLWAVPSSLHLHPPQHLGVPTLAGMLEKAGRRYHGVGTHGAGPSEWGGSTAGMGEVFLVVRILDCPSCIVLAFRARCGLGRALLMSARFMTLRARELALGWRQDRVG